MSQIIVIPVVLAVGLIGIFVGVHFLSAFLTRRINDSLLKPLRDKGIEPDSFFQGGRYIAGHPSLDNPIQAVLLRNDGDQLEIYSGVLPTANVPIMIKPKLCGTILKSRINDIALEDVSSIEKRITITRLVGFGIFAFADGLKKTTKKNAAYVVITWNDGRLNHETIFEFSGPTALSTANVTRNRIVRELDKTVSAQASIL